MTDIVEQTDSLAFKFPGEKEYEHIKNLVAIAIKSGFLPSTINTAEKGVIILFAARELGIPPMTAFWEVAIVQGRPCISARLQRALVFARFPDAYWYVEVSTPQKCVIKAGRTKDSVQTFEFTIEEAKLAGLAGKENWQKWPRDMLMARTSGRVVRALFPDIVLAAAYNREEMADRDDVEFTVDREIGPTTPITAKKSLKDRLEKAVAKDESLVIDAEPETAPAEPTQPEVSAPSAPEPELKGAKVQRYPGFEETKLTKPPF